MQTKTEAMAEFLSRVKELCGLYGWSQQQACRHIRTLESGRYLRVVQELKRQQWGVHY